MNCRRFNNLVFDYLDGSLSARARAAADAHLGSCNACRQALQQNRQFAQFLTGRFHQETESLALRPQVRRRIQAAVETASAPVSRPVRMLAWWPRLAWRPRLAWGTAIAAALLVAVSLLTWFPLGRHAPLEQMAQSRPHATQAAVALCFSYCAPTYNFHLEGDFVVDSLTCNPCVVQETVWLAHN
jgi:anti-sigma factor RsiW